VEDRRPGASAEDFARTAKRLVGDRAKKLFTTLRVMNDNDNDDDYGSKSGGVAITERTQGRLSGRSVPAGSGVVDRSDLG